MAHWLACLPLMWKVIGFAPWLCHPKDHDKNYIQTHCRLVIVLSIQVI